MKLAKNKDRQAQGVYQAKTIKMLAKSLLMIRK